MATGEQDEPNRPSPEPSARLKHRDASADERFGKTAQTPSARVDRSPACGAFASAQPTMPPKANMASLGGRPGQGTWARRQTRLTVDSSRWTAGLDCSHKRVRRKGTKRAVMRQMKVGRNQRAEISRLRRALDEKERTVRGLAAQQARWILADLDSAGVPQPSMDMSVESDQPEIAEENATSGVDWLVPTPRSSKAGATHALELDRRGAINMAVLISEYRADSTFLSHYSSSDVNPRQLPGHVEGIAKRPKSEAFVDQLLTEYRSNLEILEESRRFLLKQFATMPSETRASSFHLSPMSSQTDLSLISDTQSESEKSGHVRRSESLSRTTRESSLEPRDELRIARDQVDDLKHSNKKLEKSLRCTREREDRLKSQLHRLSESKTRIERRLQDALDAKENLDNEVRALSTLNGRLAKELHEHHGRLGVAEQDQKSMVERMQELQNERDMLSSRLDKANREIGSLQELDTERKTKLDQMMRQASSVEAHLLTALERVETLSSEYAERKQSTQPLDPPTKHQLDVAELKLKVAETSSEEQKTRIGYLEDKERELLHEIGDLSQSNHALNQELEATHAELLKLRESIQTMSDDLDNTKDQALALRRHAEQTHRYNGILEENIARLQKDNNKTIQRLRFLGVKLVATNKDNSKLQTRVVRAEHALEEAIDENARLSERLRDTTAGIESAEQSVVALDEEFKRFITESEKKYHVQKRELATLKAAKHSADERCSIYELEVQRLQEVSMSLQHVVNSFNTSDLEGTDQDSIVSKRSRHSTSTREPVIKEGDLAEELSTIQDNMAKLHSVLARIRLRQDLDSLKGTGHVKQDSVVDVPQPNSPRMSVRSSHRSSAGSPTGSMTSSAKPNVVNFSRLSGRASGQFSREPSPGTQMLHSGQVRTLHRDTPSWSSSNSTLLDGARAISPSYRRPGTESVTSDHSTFDEIEEEDMESTTEETQAAPAPTHTHSHSRMTSISAVTAGPPVDPTHPLLAASSKPAILITQSTETTFTPIASAIPAPPSPTPSSSTTTSSSSRNLPSMMDFAQPQKIDLSAFLNAPGKRVTSSRSLADMRQPAGLGIQTTISAGQSNNGMNEFQFGANSPPSVSALNEIGKTRLRRLNPSLDLTTRMGPPPRMGSYDGALGNSGTPTLGGSAGQSARSSYDGRSVGSGSYTNEVAGSEGEEYQPGVKLLSSSPPREDKKRGQGNKKKLFGIMGKRKS